MHRIYRIEFEQAVKGYIDEYWKARDAGEQFRAATISLDLALYRANYWDQFLDTVHTPHQDIYEDESRMAWLAVGGARDVLDDLVADGQLTSEDK